MSPGRTNAQRFLFYAKIHFILLLLLISLCIPVTGLMNVSADNAKEIPAIRNATEYETQGKALVAGRDWSGVITVPERGLYTIHITLNCSVSRGMP